jgi:hypothetical protein
MPTMRRILACTLLSNNKHLIANFTSTVAEDTEETNGTRHFIAWWNRECTEHAKFLVRTTTQRQTVSTAAAVVVRREEAGPFLFNFTTKELDGHGFILTTERAGCVRTTEAIWEVKVARR